jgi:hypothetical protein
MPSSPVVCDPAQLRSLGVGHVRFTTVGRLHHSAYLLCCSRNYLNLVATQPTCRTAMPIPSQNNHTTSGHDYNAQGPCENVDVLEKTLNLHVFPSCPRHLEYTSAHSLAAVHARLVGGHQWALGSFACAEGGGESLLLVTASPMQMCLLVLWRYHSYQTGCAASSPCKHMRV